MKKLQLIEPVFVANLHLLHQAAKLLQEHGIACRHSKPRRDQGILRVSKSDAETARRLLPQISPQAIVSAAEAVYFFCTRCQAVLSRGANWCPDCGEFVGDPHAM